MVRAKFTLTTIKQNSWNPESRTLVFTPQYDQSIPEDKRFAKSCPSGEFWIQVDNPEALKRFELGKPYYLDFTPVEQ